MHRAERTFLTTSTAAGTHAWPLRTFANGHAALPAVEERGQPLLPLNTVDDRPPRPPGEAHLPAAQGVQRGFITASDAAKCNVAGNPARGGARQTCGLVWICGVAD